MPPKQLQSSFLFIHPGKAKSLRIQIFLGQHIGRGYDDAAPGGKQFAFASTCPAVIQNA